MSVTDTAKIFAPHDSCAFKLQSTQIFAPLIPIEQIPISKYTNPANGIIAFYWSKSESLTSLTIPCTFILICKWHEYWNYAETHEIQETYNLKQFLKGPPLWEGPNINSLPSKTLWSEKVNKVV